MNAWKSSWVMRTCGRLAFVGVLSSVLLSSQTAMSQNDVVPSKDEFIDLEADPQPIARIADLVTYPSEALKTGREADVITRALIVKDGSVSKVSIERSGGPQFDSAAVSALEHARFVPAMAQGKPVSIWFTIPIHFKLNSNLNSESQNSQSSGRDTVLMPINSALDLVADQVEPKPLSRIADHLKYPEAALQLGIEGHVVLDALIGLDGGVEKIEVLRADNAMFKVPAIEAVLNTRFSPALLKGKPVRIWFTVPITFKLQPDKLQLKIPVHNNSFQPLPRP